MLRSPAARCLTTLAVVALLSPAPATAQARSDTARYVVLASGRVTGSYLEWRAGDTLRSVYEYNDRSRGPRIESSVLLDPAGIPRWLVARGHGYLKEPVAETLVVADGAARWKNASERGTRRLSTAAFYVTANESPTTTTEFTRAALRNGGRLPLLPVGEALVERVGEHVAELGGAPLRLTMLRMSNVGFSPSYYWMDEATGRFAFPSNWFSVVPAGWESLVPALVAKQEGADRDWFARLARELPRRPSGALVIRNARLFDAATATARERMSVVVQDGRITAVGPAASVRVPAGAEVVDATGATLLPGLWDMHVHIGAGPTGLMMLAAGITTARDLGNDTSLAPQLRRRFETDSLIGPRLLLGGIIDGPGQYRVPIGLVADDSASLVRAIDAYAAKGYVQVKLYSSLDPTLVPVGVRAAHARGMRVSGHVPNGMTAEQVVLAGFDEVQHANMLLLNFLDSVGDTRTMERFTAVAARAADIDLAGERVRRFARLLAARGVEIDPTLVAFEGMFTARPGEVDPSQAAIAERVPPSVRRNFLSGGLPVPEGMDERYRRSWLAMKRVVRVMHDAGVQVLAGTDHFPTGFALHRELELYVEAGIPAPKVLQLATLGAARTMKQDDRYGTVAPGKVADLVLVRGDPTRTISDIRRVELTVKNGTVYRSADLLSAVGVRPAPAAGESKR